MRQAFEDLIEFHLADRRELPDSGPGIPKDADLVKLRVRLIKEEFLELMAAIHAGDIVETADALADLCYVTIGTALAMGIDLPVVWDEVHRTNMAKFGPGSGRNGWGKIVKPPGWVPPDIVGILMTQRPLAEIYGHPEYSTEA